jgi:hypothetical protein
MSYGADGSWIRYTSGGEYFTTGTISDGSTGVYTFNLTVNADTPADVYDLVFGVGIKSGGTLFQEEHFYVEVVGATAPPLVLSSPNGGESLNADAVQTITWQGGGAGDTIQIDFSSNNGGNWTQVASNLSNTGSYNWTVPQINSSQCKIRISNGSETATSASAFGISYVPPAAPVISGFVRDSGGAAISGVAVSATNGGGITTTDASGAYSLTVPYGWSGTVTAGKTGYTFNPASNSYSNLTADRSNENFVGTPPAVPVVSGFIRTSGGAAISGVTVTASNAGGSATTNASGFYSISVSYGWSGTVTPSKATYTFNPASNSYSNLTADRSNENYTGTPPASPVISGYVRTSGGAAISAVAVTASNGGGSATTSATGFYSVVVPFGWSGTVTPTKANYTINPVSLSYSNVNADVSNENYIGIPPASPVISGFVTDSGGAAISGVSVTASNGGGAATSDGSGYYSLAVSFGWSGTITFSQADHTFVPATFTYSNVTADTSNQDSVGTAAAYNIADHVFGLEVSQKLDYNDPCVADDLVYVFNFWAETDGSIEQVEILSPSGKSFVIPKQAQSNSGTAKTWYSTDGTSHWWEYEDVSADSGLPANYGDGTYTVTVSTGAGSNEQTSLWYGVPSTSDAIPQPTQEPVMTSPQNQGWSTSPVDFAWQSCIDTNTVSIQLTLDSVGTSELVDVTLPKNSTGTAGVALANGDWNSTLSFDNQHEASNGDGIYTRIGKYSESDYIFTVGLDPTGALLSEDFADGDFVGWTIVDQGAHFAPSAWSAATGEMIQGSNIYSESVNRDELGKLGTYALYTNGLSWTDYKTTVTISSDDDDAVGLMFRCQDSSSYYRFSWDEQRAYRRLIKMVNGQASLLDEDSAAYVTGQSYSIEVSAIGSTLEVRVDGALVLAANDSSLASGSIGLYSWGSEGAYFDDIQVEDMIGNRPPVITSVTAAPSVIRDNESSQLEVVAQDPDGGPAALSYSWSVGAGQGSLSNTAIANPVYTPADVSSTKTITLTVQVSDGEKTTTANVDVTVRDADAAALLLDENFGTGSFSGWTIVNQVVNSAPSAWSAATGELIQSSNIYSEPVNRDELGKLGTYAWYAAGSNWSNYQVLMNIRSEDDDAIGVMFRYQGPENYYRFSWDKQRAYRRLVKLVNGQVTLLAEDSVAYVTGQNYQLQIVADGPALEVYIDGVQVFSVTDSSLSSGSIGLYSWGNEGACFDDIQVEDMAAGPSGDVVSVSKAEYKVYSQELRVEAASSYQPDVQLSLEGYGAMSWNSEKNKYEYREAPVSDPGGTVTVTSSQGGTATASVVYRYDGGDEITIKKAEFNTEDDELRVEATCLGQPTAQLTLEGYGIMTWKSDKQKYEYRKENSNDPGGSVTVTSNLGGSASATIEYKD